MDQNHAGDGAGLAAPPARRRVQRVPRELVILERLARIEEAIRTAGLGTVSPRNRILVQLSGKLDHIHDDLVAVREWARIPRPECYPAPPPEPGRRRQANGREERQGEEQR